MKQAVWNGTVIAESDDIAIVDGYTYFPEADVRQEFLRPSQHKSACHWKGVASYYSLEVDGRRNDDAAWYYPDPSTLATERGVKGRIAFWKGVEIVDAAAAAPTVRNRA